MDAHLRAHREGMGGGAPAPLGHCLRVPPRGLHSSASVASHGCTSRADFCSWREPPGKGQLPVGVQPRCAELNGAERVPTPRGADCTCCSISAEQLSFLLLLSSHCDPTKYVSLRATVLSGNPLTLTPRIKTLRLLWKSSTSWSHFFKISHHCAESTENT